MEDKKKKSGMFWAAGKVMLFGLLAAFVAEVTLCQLSFWTSAGKEGEDLTKRAEVAGHYFTAEDMESVQGSGFEDFLRQ